jgi:hypothetical protein
VNEISHEFCLIIRKQSTGAIFPTNVEESTLPSTLPEFTYLATLNFFVNFRIDNPLRHQSHNYFYYLWTFEKKQSQINGSVPEGVNGIYKLIFNFGIELWYFFKVLGAQ